MDRSKPRFKAAGYSADQMRKIGETIVLGQRARIGAGLGVGDAPAPPLSTKGKRGGYAAAKAKRTGVGIRNWRLSGHTMASMAVLVSRKNVVRVGFTTAKANQRAYMNNAKYRQFGLSPRNKSELLVAYRTLGSPVSSGQ